MKILRSILFYILPLTFFCTGYADDTKLDYWNVQRKGANYFNQVPSDDRFLTAKEVGIPFARLAPDNTTKQLISTLINSV